MLFGQQEGQVQYACEDRQLELVLKDWEQRYDLAFAFESGILDQKRISIKLEGLPIRLALEQLFRNTALSFQVLEERYVLIKNAAPAPVYKELCGVVIDGQTSEPLPFASIVLIGKSKGTQTDTSGRFSFQLLPEELTDLEISYIGYQKQVLATGQITKGACPTISLQPAVLDIPEVVIKDFTVDMLDLDASPESRIRFRPEKIPTLPGWGEPDVLRSLQLLPGISTVDESAANLNIRGGTPDQNLLLLDGIPIYHAGHFFGLYSAFNPFAVQQVDVYRGGFGARYGGRISGIIDIQGKPSQTEQVEIGTGLNLISAQVFAEFPLIKNKMSLMVAARRSYTDIIRSNTFQSLFNRASQRGRLFENKLEQSFGAAINVDPNFHFSDYHGKWTWQASDKDHISIAGYYGDDRFDYNYEEEYVDYATRDDLDLTNWGMSAQYHRKWDSHWETNAKLTYSRFLNNYLFQISFLENDNPFNGQFGHVNRLSDLTFLLEQSWTPNEYQKLQVGWQYSNQKTEFRSWEQERNSKRESSQEGLIPQTHSFYLEYNGKLTDKLGANIGIRLDGFRNHHQDGALLRNERAWQPRLGLVWRPIDPDFQLKGQFGIYRQFIYQIPADYNSLGAGEQLWVTADDYFPAPYSSQWSIGFAIHKPKFLLDVDFYQRKTTNLTSWKLELEDDFENPFTQSGASFARGLDILLKNRWQKYNIWWAYSLGRVEDRYPDLNNDAFFPASQDQRHRFTWTHMLALPKWDFSVSWNFASGKPFTVPLAAEAEWDPEDEFLYYSLIYEQPNNDRLPAYHRLDLSANYKFSRPKWRGKVGLSIFNLYNRVNYLDIDFLIFGPDLEEGETEPEMVILPRQLLSLTPNVFVELEW